MRTPVTTTSAKVDGILYTVGDLVWRVRPDFRLEEGKVRRFERGYYNHDGRFCDLDDRPVPKPYKAAFRVVAQFQCGYGWESQGSEYKFFTTKQKAQRKLVRELEYKIAKLDCELEATKELRQATLDQLALMPEIVYG